jgi:hypothetical protein
MRLINRSILPLVVASAAVPFQTPPSINAMAVRKSVSELTPTQRDITTTTPNTSVNAIAQRETRGTTVLVISMLLLLIFTDLMVTGHTKKGGARYFTEQRRLPLRHTPRLHVHFPPTSACIPSATRRHDYIAGVYPPVSSNIQNVPNPHVRLHGRSHLLSHTPLEVRGACLGLTAVCGQQYRRAHSRP